MRPLHMACRYNSGSATQYLLGQGADVNAKDIKGKTPLHYATRRGHDLVTKVRAHKYTLKYKNNKKFKDSVFVYNFPHVVYIIDVAVCV